MRLSCNDFKIWKLVEGNCKLYVFVCFLIVVIVNIWIFLFIRLCNLCFLRNILRKIPGAATVFSDPHAQNHRNLLPWNYSLQIDMLANTLKINIIFIHFIKQLSREKLRIRNHVSSFTLQKFKVKEISTKTLAIY